MSSVVCLILAVFAMLAASQVASQDRMPEGIVGKPRDEARAILEELEIKYQVIYEDSCAFNLTVTATDPEEGAPFNGDLQFATITVTTGNAERVPRIVGLDVSAAESELEGSNLRFRLRDEWPIPINLCTAFRHDGTYSTIFEQDPPEGRIVCPDTEVSGHRRPNGIWVITHPDIDPNADFVARPDCGP